MNVIPFVRVPEPEGYTRDHALRWADVWARLFRIEGGFVDDPLDRGGTTKYGISLRFLMAVGGIDANHDGFADLDLNFDTVLDGQDIRRLTPDVAEALYFSHFWIQPGFWQLPRPMDAAVFDQAVNGGSKAAVRLLQRALNRQGQPHIATDGRLGPATLAKLRVELKDGRPILGAYREEAATRYRQIVANDNRQQRFLKGWLNRAAELGRV